jgi:hypothetical protein
MSLNEIRNSLHLAGKGHNELYEIFNPMRLTRVAKSVIRDHVPGNGGTWVHIFASDSTSRKWKTIRSCICLVMFLPVFWSDSLQMFDSR